MTRRIGRALTLAKQCLFILFNFVFLGPPIGWAALYPFLALYVLAKKSLAGPVSLFEWMSVLWTWPVIIPLGVPYAYWIGFAPALTAGAVVCLVHAAGFRISGLVQVAAAAASLLLSDALRGKLHLAQITPEGGLAAVASLAATVACCWLLTMERRFRVRTVSL